MTTKKKKMYIVTNATISGNYTPSLFAKKEDARDWFYELAVNDLIDAYDSDMIEILCNHVKSVAQNVLEKIVTYLSDFDNDGDVMAGKDLGVDKNASYIAKGREIIEEFNSLMRINDIPWELDFKFDDAYDLVDEIDCLSDVLENEDICLETIMEKNREKFLEYFSDRISGLEVSENNIRIEYSDDNFNDIEFFETNVN